MMNGQQQAMQTGDQDQRVEKIMQEVGQLVMAAQKVLYSEKTSKFIWQHIKTASKDPAKQAAAGALLALGVVGGEVKNLNPETVVPAGVVLTADVLDFMSKVSGNEYDEAVHKRAITAFAGKIQQMAGGAK